MNLKHELNEFCAFTSHSKHRASEDHVLLHSCGIIACYNCFLEETDSFNKIIDCPVCETKLNEKFIKIHSPNYKHDIIDDLLKEIDETRKSLKSK